MKTFDTLMIPLYLIVAMIDAVAGIKRLTEGNTEAGFLFLTLTIVFTTWACQSAARVVRDEY